MGDIAITLKNLTFSYGEKIIIDKLSLDLKKNKFYSVIGPNGSGKTTLLKNMAGLLLGSKDSVFIEDKAIENYKIKTLSKKLSYVPQSLYINVEFTVHEIVLMGRAPYKSRFAQDSERDLEAVKRAMEVTRTWQLRDNFMNRLSGGEQQRVIAARAIAQEADIVLLDEPISHVDIQHQIDLLEAFKSLSKKATVIAVLHDLNMAALFSDYIILLNNGAVADSGSPEKVLCKKNIKDIYNLNVEVINDPVNNRSHIIPVVNKNGI